MGRSLSGGERNNQVQIVGPPQKNVWHDDESAAGLGADCDKGLLDLRGTANNGGGRFDAERARRGLEWLPIVLGIGRSLWIENDRSVGSAGRDFFEQLDPFATERRLDIDEASDVATGVR